MGLERLRSDALWIVRRLRASSDSGAEVFRVVREPLVNARRTARLPAMFDRHCSQPLPELRHFERPNGLAYGELPRARGTDAALDRPGRLMNAEHATNLGASAPVQTHRLTSYAAMVDEAPELGGFGSCREFRGRRAEIELPTLLCDVKMFLEIGARA